MKKRFAIFVSGTGSNLKAVLDSFGEEIDFYVFSNKREAPGLLWAKRRGHSVQVLDVGPDSWEKTAKSLNQLCIEHLFLLGFMKIVPEKFLKSFKGLVLNLHPSLLPAFSGLKALERSIEAQQSIGATVHKVTEALDEGPVVCQKAIVAEGSQALQSFKVRFAEQFLVSRVYAKALVGISK